MNEKKQVTSFHCANLFEIHNLHTSCSMLLRKLAHLCKAVSILYLFYSDFYMNIYFFNIFILIFSLFSAVAISPSFFSHSADPVLLLSYDSSSSSVSSSPHLLLLPHFLTSLLHPSDVREEKETGSASLIGQGRRHPRLWLYVPGRCVMLA